MKTEGDTDDKDSESKWNDTVNSYLSSKLSVEASPTKNKKMKKAKTPESEFSAPLKRTLRPRATDGKVIV